MVFVIIAVCMNLLAVSLSLWSMYTWKELTKELRKKEKLLDEVRMQYLELIRLPKLPKGMVIKLPEKKGS